MGNGQPIASEGGAGSSPSPEPAYRRGPRFSRFTPFLLAFATILLALGSALWLTWTEAITVAADAFFVVYLIPALAGIPFKTGDFLRKHAASSDAPVFLIFAITLATVGAAMTSLFIAINAQDKPGALQYVLALLSVPLGWATIHLMSAIHYAHLFWQPNAGEDQPRKGLDFPGTKDPDGWDFVYFAFVIGMSAQTADVSITARHVRRFSLMHAIVSYFFNTVLVAAAVNLAVSLNP